MGFFYQNRKKNPSVTVTIILNYKAASNRRTNRHLLLFFILKTEINNNCFVWIFVNVNVYSNFNVAEEKKN